MRELTSEQKVGLCIYQHCWRKEQIYFSKLVELFKEIIDRTEISRIEDKLFDLCMINAEWENNGDGWVREYRISRCYDAYFHGLNELDTNTLTTPK
jgi:hypothetical protein